MFDQQLENLRRSILWAEQDQNIEIFRMAGVQLEALERYVLVLSEQDQARAYEAIDQMLPFDWPLWMEACRYGDGCVQPLSLTLH